MIDGKFDVVFRGQIVRNVDESVVKSNLVTLFKSSPEAVEKLFGGNEVVVRKGLDYSTAMKYQSALKKAGALALIKEIEQQTVASQPAAGQSSQGKATFGVPAEESSTQENANHNQLSNVQSSSLNNRPLTDKTASQPEIGQSNSSDDAVSNEITVAEPGAQLLPDKVYEKREIDTSQLSLASAGERIMPERPPEEYPQPSIDHLKLED